MMKNFIARTNISTCSIKKNSCANRRGCRVILRNEEKLYLRFDNNGIKMIPSGTFFRGVMVQ